MKILDDIRVIDFTHAWFGPFCTMLLGDLGADVIKVEPPWGELGRLGPGELYQGASTTFYALNLNKKGICINLKNEDGLDIIKELIKKSDVVIQNFAPGTFERLGLGYDVLKKIKPDIIYAALSGFGQEGPYSEYGSYAVVSEAISGHSYATGKKYDYNGPPINMSGALGDLAPALLAALSIVSAIRYRDRTGEGQWIDVNQVDSMVALNCCESVAYELFKASPIDRSQKVENSYIQLWGFIKVKDGWLQLAGNRPKAIDALKKKWGLEEITLDIVERKLDKLTRIEAFNLLAKEGLPCAPVYEAYEAINDPHLRYRDMWIEVEHQQIGKYKTPNFPVKFSRSPLIKRTASPILGQDTMQILSEVLGKTNDELIKLEKSGVIVKN